MVEGPKLNTLFVFLGHYEPFRIGTERSMLSIRRGLDVSPCYGLHGF